MSRDDDTPEKADVESLRRLLEYAQLAAGELDLGLAERLIGAALLALGETAETRHVDAVPDLVTPDQIH